MPSTIEPLGPGEQAGFIAACRSPSLWAFAVAARHVGFAAAIDACRARDLPLDVADELRVLGYDVSSLPSQEDITALISIFRRRARKLKLDDAERLLSERYRFLAREASP